MKYIPSSSYASPGGTSAIPQMVQRRRTFHVFGFIATLLLLGSLASAGGVVFYKKELEKQLTEAQAGLASKSTVDNEKKIAEIGSFHLRLKTAELLLENHRAPSRLLAELEKITKKTVQFTSFNYSYDPGFDVTLELGGSTDELTSVALQKIKLLEDTIFTVFTVEGITSTLEAPDATETDTQEGVEEQKIAFGVKGLLKDDVVLYNGTASVFSSVPPATTSVQNEEGEPEEETVATTTTNNNEINQ